ncbi:SubName: Full=Related to ferroportin 1 {ECO:0000313/EMBL:CCA68615.1} [Serendipita indica DSM 11827]|nr:SubName: Full=Related to ferroportin 1 {ECO:0000313/EMBL:CCA68615.1} [Serendipita indica DSM 11827]
MPHNESSAPENAFLLPPEEDQVDVEVGGSGFWCLCIQHASKQAQLTSGDRTSEYLMYLLLVVIFQTTLLPSAIFGFSATLSGILLSRWVGTLVDSHPKLSLVRTCIFIQKTSAAIAYAAFALLLSTPQQPPSLQDEYNLLNYSAIVLCGCALRVSTICIQIAVERDWVTCIAHGSDRALSRLNVSLRRVDLFCNLTAPLVVSIFTTLLSYRTTSLLMFAVSLLTMGFELYWIDVVYSSFPRLHAEQRASESPLEEPRGWKSALANQLNDWSEFIQLPVFLSSVALSLLYITVLSFDGNMLGYLKTKKFEDSFLAAMRSLGVITGLLGTLVAPALETRLGSARAGSWSIWSEAICLVPVTFAFAQQLRKNEKTLPSVSSALIFGGMAASRVGLWSFDLIQLKQLQEALVNHPRRNTLTALQFSMANMADLLKYGSWS